VFEIGEKNEKKNSFGTNERIHPDYPFIKSEISYSAIAEMAQKPNDVICRRVPISFLNEKVADEILPEVVEILGEELNWD